MCVHQLEKVTQPLRLFGFFSYLLKRLPTGIPPAPLSSTGVPTPKAEVLAVSHHITATYKRALVSRLRRAALLGVPLSFQTARVSSNLEFRV